MESFSKNIDYCLMALQFVTRVNHFIKSRTSKLKKAEQ